MTVVCNQITADIIRDCANPPVRGQHNRVIIVRRADIESITYNSSNHLIIEAITIATGARAFEYVGDGRMLANNIEKITDDFGTRYNHQLPFTIYGNTPSIKKELEALSNEEKGVLAIVSQNYKGSATTPNAKWVVYGKDCGLMPVVLTDAEGRNQYAITLGSMEGFEEPHLPANIYLTDEATTDALVEALLEVQSA